MRRALIVEADDLGLSRSFNAGIRTAASKGIVTSTCVRVNGAAFDEAVEEVVPEVPALGIGVHLNIVEGTTTRSDVPRASPLVDGGGAYRMNFPKLLLRQRDPRLLAEIEADYRHQIEIALSRLPSIDHLNSHQHSHAVPALFALVCRLAEEYGIPFVRFLRERFVFSGTLSSHISGWYPANLTKVAVLNQLAPANGEAAKLLGVRTNDWFVGVAYTGHMNAGRILRGLRELPDDVSVVEVLTHPCPSIADPTQQFVAPYLRSYVTHPARANELEAVTDPALGTALAADGWTLTTYGQIATVSARS